MYQFLKNTSKYVHRDFFRFLKDRLNDNKNYPVYLKTHGLNVIYFHFRIQDTPKYYVNDPEYFEKQMVERYN